MRNNIAHVVCDSAELARLKTAKELHLNKTAYQPINECMAAFGEVVLAVYNEGNESESGIEVALITINDRKPKDGSFPNAFNDLEAGEIFSSPELAQGELLGLVNVRRPSFVVRRTSTIACEHSSGRIFASIIIKLGQDAYLGKSSDEFEHGSSRMKN
jgi:hypothetical protein